MSLETLNPYQEEIDKPRDKCAIVGAMSLNGENVAPMTRIILHAQQNRGEDGAGIAALDAYSGTFRDYKALGLVLAQAFPDGKLEEEGLMGSVAIGHNRYATAGKRRDEVSTDKEKIECLQPYTVSYNRRSISVGHNGNIKQKYVDQMKRELPPDIPYQSDTDSEVPAWRIIFAPGETMRDKVINGFDGIIGAYAYVVATDEGEIFGITDPLGIRPLWYAETENERFLVSESRGLEYVPGMRRIEEIQGGKLVHIRRDGSMTVDQLFPEAQMARCAVEALYLSHPFSYEGGMEIREKRRRMGIALAKERPFPQGYTVVGIPDSGYEIAEAYAEELNLQMIQLIKKDRYRPGRTFINNSMSQRDYDLDLKFTISRAVEGRKLVGVDDTGIRGKTSSKLNERLRQMGALEIHDLKAAPHFVEPCDKGVDIATRDELIALESEGRGGYRERANEEIARETNADSVYFLSKEGLEWALSEERGSCMNCMGGVDPVGRLLASNPDAYRQILLPR